MSNRNTRPYWFIYLFAEADITRVSSRHCFVSVKRVVDWVVTDLQIPTELSQLFLFLSYSKWKWSFEFVIDTFRNPWLFSNYFAVYPFHFRVSRMTELPEVRNTFRIKRRGTRIIYVNTNRCTPLCIDGVRMSECEFVRAWEARYHVLFAIFLR